MRTKDQLVTYCAGILAIIDSKEDAGQHRGGLLAVEYSKAYDELIQVLRKEQEDETRKSNELSRRLHENRTQGSRS